MDLLHHTLVSAGIYYGFIFLICRLGRIFAQNTLKTDWHLQVAYDFFAALHVCLYTFENGLIYAKYGNYGLALSIFFSVQVFLFELGRGNATPCGILKDFLTRKIGAKQLVASVTAQLVVARIAFPVAQMIRTYLFCPIHVARAAVWSCYTDLKVPMLWGVYYEFLATLIYGVTCLAASLHLPTALSWPTIGVATSLTTLSGIHLTGMYYNPILASSVHFGCEGASNVAHIAVYWIGPIIATLLLAEIQQKRYLSGKT